MKTFICNSCGAVCFRDSTEKPMFRIEGGEIEMKADDKTEVRNALQYAKWFLKKLQCRILDSPLPGVYLWFEYRY